MLRLYDPVYLQTHRLAKDLSQSNPNLRPAQAGAFLREELLRAIEALKPGDGRQDRAWRAYRIMQLRYVEAQDAAEVQRDLGLAKSQYYREHERALEALITEFRDMHPEVSDRPAEDQLRTEPLPSTAVRASQTNLPLPATSFIGREPELAQIEGLLQNHRLLTLHGPGGTGKTRLALEVGRRLLDRYTDGVSFVDLAGLSDPSLVANTVAFALGFVDEPRQSVLSTLQHALGPKQLLLILDNCEHLIGACADLAAGLIQYCPQLYLLLTSRETANVAGERVYRVPTLSAPRPDQASDFETLRTFESVRLFEDRAVLSAPNFRLTEAAAPAVAEICSRLEGIPLAIELAAARVRVLSPQQIATRLHDRFQLLTGGSRDALPRHQTLRSLVDWSYELLAENEVALLRRLAVFAGGWSLEAAEAVCAGGGIEASEVLDLLSQLVAKSLVIADDAGDDTIRYRLLETLREYARERLAGSGEEEAVWRAHEAYYLQQAEDAASALLGPDQVQWFDLVEREHDNYREILGRCRQRGSLGYAPEAGLRIAAGLYWFWTVRNYWSEGREWLTAMLDLAGGAPSRARGRGLVSAGYMATLQGDHVAAKPLMEDGVAVARQVGTAADLGFCLAFYAYSGVLRGEQVWTEETMGEALRVLEEDHDSEVLPMAWTGCAIAQLNQGKNDDAARSADIAVERSRAAQHSFAIAFALTCRAAIDIRSGDYERARDSLEESLALFHRLENVGTAILCVTRLAELAMSEKDTDQAGRRYQEMLAFASHVGRRLAIAEALEGLALVAELRDEPAIAARLLGAAATLRSRLGTSPTAAERDRLEQIAERLRQTLGQDYDRACREGASLSVDEAVALAQASF